MARASGSYPAGRWFKSDIRYHSWPVGQEVKTRPFHGCNMGSIPVRVTINNLNRMIRFRLFFFVSIRILNEYGLFYFRRRCRRRFMPRKTLDTSRECGRLSCQRQTIKPLGAWVVGFFAYHPHSREARVKSTVE